MESLLREYPITSAEGLALMRLAEALLRVPDAETAIALTADQLGRADFDARRRRRAPHRMLASCRPARSRCRSASCPSAERRRRACSKRLGARTVVAATVRAIQLLGRQFVLGRSIGEAMDEAADAAAQGAGAALLATTCSAKARAPTRDAERYLAATATRSRAIAARARRRDVRRKQRDGISIKLSALFSRYEDAQRERVFAELLPRVLAAGRARGARPTST